MLLVTDTGTFIISSIILAKEELQNRKKIRINLKIIFKNLMYHLKSCLPVVYHQKIKEFEKRLMITCSFGAGEGN
jgi:hypothetical protein